MNNETLNESTFANFRRELQTLNYAELNYLISDIMLEIKKRSYNEGMVKAMTSGISAEQSAIASTPVTPQKSDQQLRDEIIEKAKRDVAEVVEDESFQYTFRYKSHSKEERLGGTRAKVQFVINNEKRTVVAIVRNYYFDTVMSRGIAKCDPSDCFNAHIGKAIALRRALGLEVPTEYLNAPQPTEARIGDVVRSLMSGTIGTKVESEEGKHTLINDGIYYTLAHSACNVIDDSRKNIGGDEVTE